MKALTVTYQVDSVDVTIRVDSRFTEEDPLLRADVLKDAIEALQGLYRQAMTDLFPSLDL
jgi:hypothetical protein